SAETLFAVSPQGTHCSGLLAEGLVVGETVRCPWHHACFDLRTGEALRAPALSPIACWEVVRRDGIIKVTHKREQPQSRIRVEIVGNPEKIVIVGGRPSRSAASQMLRPGGFPSTLVILSPDD